jgi:UDP-N-acetylmuramate--alanine ligase
MADEIILLPIYPARELPMEGVTSDMLLHKMKNKNQAVKTKEEVLQWVAANKNELIITAGAGDIDTLVNAIKEIVNK